MTDHDSSVALARFVQSLRDDPFYSPAISRSGGKGVSSEDMYTWILAKQELAGAIRLLEVINPGCTERAGIVVPAIFEMKA